MLALMRNEDSKMIGGRNLKDWLIIVFLLGILCTAASGKIIYVDDDVPADFSNIQAAINDANNGDTVIVADGVYTGPGNRDIIISGKAITQARGDNPRWDGGGGIYILDASPTITNCTFSGNSTSNRGGGIASSWYMTVRAKLTNCILWGNRDSGGTDESAQIHDYGIMQVVNYCCIQGLTGALGGIGNIGDDPCFADANNDDYHLRSQAGRWTSASSVEPDPNEGRWTRDEVTSPCIDAGDPVSPVGLEPFPNGGRVNMGAFGGTIEASKSYFGEPVCETIVAGDINGDCIVNFNDFAIIALHWLRDENH